MHHHVLKKLLLGFTAFILCNYSSTTFPMQIAQKTVEIVSTIFKEEAPLIGKIGALSLGAAVTFGIVHGQITSHFFPEFIAHWRSHKNHSKKTNDIEKIYNTITTSPIKEGLFWGIKMFWKKGLIYGTPLYLANRIGSAPEYNSKQLAIYAFLSLPIIGILSLGYGYGYYKTQFKSDKSYTYTSNHFEELNTDRVPPFKSFDESQKASIFLSGVTCLGLSALSAAKRFNYI